MENNEEKILPRYLNLDASLDALKPDESPYIRGTQSAINGNDPTLQIGLNNPTGEGSNTLTLTPIRSNSPIPNVLLPPGINKYIGCFESVVTRELYHLNKNSNGNDGVYVVSGDTGAWDTVLIDKQLNFSDNPEAYMAEHRVRIRVIYDSNQNVVEKILLITDGNSWQKWINVIAAIKTNGFNASEFPYWSLLPPHFDRRELFEWASRPIMYNPKAQTLPNTPVDAGKTNMMVDQAFQFAVLTTNTDGRQTKLSPYSLPLIIKSEDFLNNPDQLPKNAMLTIYAGSPLTESMDIYVRFSAKQQAGVPSKAPWGDWYKLERIYKFSGSEISSGQVLSTDYWLRKNQWVNYNYDPVFNTIQYIFDNSKLAEIVSQYNAKLLQNDIPIASRAMTDLGDAVALGDNKYYYDNFPDTTLNNLDVAVEEKSNSECDIPLRTMKFYAYVGRDGQNFRYDSQVGYINGSDTTTVLFGGLQMGGGLALFGHNVNLCDNNNGTNGAVNFTLPSICIQESTDLSLNFADKKAFRLYLKGTPYYADGVWATVSGDGKTITPLASLLDFSNNDILTFVQSVFTSGGYFICMFTVQAPAGRYDVAIGRHDVDSSGDYRNTSTYVMGIANSKITTKTDIEGVTPPLILTSIKPQNALVSTSKEMEVDCTAGDVDTWGNGADLFYILAPYINAGNGSGSGIAGLTGARYRFIEGYLQESPDNPVGVELFPYALTVTTDDGGGFTDKNGFYFGYSKAHASDSANMLFTVRMNCRYPVVFQVPTNGIGKAGVSGNGWFQNPAAYVSDHNPDIAGVFGDCNRMIYSGKVTNLDGTQVYSNIAISIKDGATTLTKSDGTFELVVHNGQAALRVSNIYVNAGGNFLITLDGCGTLPLFLFDEFKVACNNCTVRNYPIPLNLKINVQGGTEFSLKENATYSVGCYCADLAGRLQFVNLIKNLLVPSFLTRDDVKATFFQLIIKGALKLNPDFKWFAPAVSDKLNIINPTQWVGDSIVYVDNNGNVVTDPASAVFCSISITSLYNYNIGKNFSVLAAYQFSAGDRLRILDDGNGNLFDTADFGEPIDLQIYGTNYNQAAQAAQIVPFTGNVPIINNNINTTTSTTENNTAVTLYVKYDARLDKLIKNNGFWIEIYTPAQQPQEVAFNEMDWHPVIDGEVADFIGYANGSPQYNFPKTININFWDTYLYSRNITIPNVGDKFISHPFESTSISDAFGQGVTSGGRQWVKNDNAKQTWYDSDIIKSDEFDSDFINGIGTFRGVLADGTSNRKDFTQYPYGRIIAMRTERNIVIIICENDWFTTDFQFHFTYANEQGVMVTNLDNNLSTPHQKVGMSYGCRLEDTSTIIIGDGFVAWLDAKNEGFIICDYSSAEDVSDITGKDGAKYGIKSYLIKKVQFITNWNLNNPLSSRFDIVTGLDRVRRDIYLTFHPRKNNSNDLHNFINRRRNIDLSHQETVVYNLDARRWTRFGDIAPEGYGKLKGNKTGNEFISFAAGLPFYQNNTGNTSFLKFFGLQVQPVIVAVFNKFADSIVVFKSISQNILPNNLYCDLIYDNEQNSFSYIPNNLWSRKQNIFYAAILRDMTSYPPVDTKQLFRSMLQDGKTLNGRYLVVRFIGAPETSGQYFQLSELFYSVVESGDNKK